MSLFLLAVAFVLTGVTGVSNKALVEWGLGRYSSIYLVGYWGVGMLIGLVVRLTSKHGIHRHDIAIGAMMGITGALAMVCLMIALQGVPGVVAFPVRSCANVALTAGASYLLWREDLSPSQWLGVGLAVGAIYLLL